MGSSDSSDSGSSEALLALMGNMLLPSVTDGLTVNC